jgi:hypothetical protein
VTLTEERFQLPLLADAGAKPQRFVASDTPDPGIGPFGAFAASPRAPGTEKRFLYCVLGVCTRSEHLKAACQR